jgi:hypothetical protein
VKTGARLIPLASERGGKIGGVAALCGEDLAVVAGGGFSDSQQLEGEVGRVRRCSEEGDGGSRAIRQATVACEGEMEEGEAEAVAPGKERGGATMTYQRRWWRSRTGAVRHRRLRTAWSGAGAYIPAQTCVWTALPMAANQGVAWGDNATDWRAPHVSGFKISINSEIDHSCGKNS